MKKFNLEFMYNELSKSFKDNDNLLFYTSKNQTLALYPNGHRIPEIIFIAPTEITKSFSNLLGIASNLIEHDPDEIFCLDTDMDSYDIHISLDLHHENYQDNLPEELKHICQNITIDEFYSIIHIFPKDYHS